MNLQKKNLCSALLNELLHDIGMTTYDIRQQLDMEAEETKVRVPQRRVIEGGLERSLIETDETGGIERLLTGLQTQVRRCGSAGVTLVYAPYLTKPSRLTITLSKEEL